MKSIYLFILFACSCMAANAQLPKLSSLNAAPATVFIDFDGQYVTATAWNMRGDIDAAPSGLSPAAISEIFGRVSEDYRPFNLNITTDSVAYWAAPKNKRMRVIVTPSSQWYGAAGGVAYVGSFTWGDNTPAWVFSALLGNRPKWVAEAISHEIGHTLGLQHQSAYDANCNKIAEYSTGQGTGEIGWAPIMGAGYYQNHTTWHVGPNTIGCGSIQNDFDIIKTRNGFGLRADDHADSSTTATEINMYADTFAVSGLINTASDVDVFKLVIPHSTTLKLSAIPQNVGSNDDGANIDIQVTLLNGNDTINRFNPSTLLNAGVDTNINAGTYYLVIDGVGNIYHNDVGSLGLYNITGSIASVLPVKNFHVSGNIVNNKQQLSWSLQTDEIIQQIIVESSSDGQHFNTLATLGAAAQHYSHTVTGSETWYYRLKAVSSDGRSFFSNTIALKNRAGTGGIQVIPNTGDVLTVKSDGNFTYQLYTAGGQLLGNGQLQNGSNQVATHSAKGLLLLYCSNGSQAFTQKLIKQ